MTHRRRVLLLTLVAAGLALALRDAIHEIVIVPLAYIGWVIGLFYRFVPQTLLWIVLIFVVLFTAARAFLISIPVRGRVLEKKDVIAGPLRQLTMLLQKQKHGIYYKWLIANRLGKIGRELLDQREDPASRRRFTRLTGRGWNPPPGVDAYLEVGLNGSFADYPQSRWGRPAPTPLDEDPRRVIEYLEGEMESSRNGHR